MRTSGRLSLHLGLVHRRVEDVARLAAGAAHEHGVHAFGVVPGDRAGALRRLVVGMGVHREDAETLSGLVGGGAMTDVSSGHDAFVPVAPLRLDPTVHLADGFDAIRGGAGHPGRLPGRRARPKRTRSARRGPSIPATADLRDVPFLTIDPPGSMDLDQAMALERTAVGLPAAVRDRRRGRRSSRPAAPSTPRPAGGSSPSTSPTGGRRCTRRS